MSEALGARLTHHMGIYVTGAVAGFVLALINVAVVTRFLAPSEFGELALLLVFSAFLTVFYNLGTLQGTFMWVFGSTGEEEVEEDSKGTKAAAAGTKRRAVGTGLVTTAAISGMGTAVIVLLAPWLADTMLGDSTRAHLVVIAAASGAGGAIWRLLSNLLRMERKPRRYVALNAIRPVLVVGAVVPLVASGGGVEGAIVGTAIGTTLSVAIGLLVTRRSFELALDRGDARMILRRGTVYVPVIISFWVAQNVDLYAVSWFAPDEEVGLYRLANRVGVFLDYAAAALFMAWGPLGGTSTFMAAAAERGKAVLGGRLLTYFVLGGLLLLLGVTVAADALVRIAPPAYADAAPLIPLMGAAFLSYGLLVAVYRTSEFPRKRLAYIACAMTAAVVFLGAALLLIPWLGAYGAALGVIIGFLAGAAGMTYLSQRGPNPIQIEYGRIAAGLALGGVCLGLARGLGPLAGSWQPAVEATGFILYPVMLVVLGVVSHEDRRAISRVVRQALPRRSRDIEKQVHALRPAAASALEAVVVRRWPVAKLADHLGARTAETEMRLVWLLRRLAGGGPRTAQDGPIAQYLFSEMPVAERDAMAAQLRSEGADPADLHRLELTLEALRNLPRRVWEETRTLSGDDSWIPSRGPGTGPGSSPSRASG